MNDFGAESASIPARRVEDWRRRLIDLSHRNRLIAFKATKATTLEIAAPSSAELLADPGRAEPWDLYFPPELKETDIEQQSDAVTTVDNLVLGARDRTRPRGRNEIAFTELNPKRVARVLDNLAKRSNTEFQDKALRILYVAAGFLDWRDEKNGKAVSSPLVLVPVELRRQSTREPYRLFFVDDEEVVINPSLTEKLRRDAGLDVPADWVWEDKPISQELDEIRHAISDSDWTVRDDAVLGLFSFQKYVMYRDLQDHEEQVLAHPIVRSLAHGRLLEEVRDADPDVPEPRDLDDAQTPQETLSILDADASQRQCVEAAKRGRSFVMQGPPGTGKSQTIANVIAEAIGDGKRVLFVSEKAAALDVVYKRLAQNGLDEYCLMLHGEHAARREVVQALDRSLTTTLQPRPVMRHDEMERLANLRTVLNDSAELLHLPEDLLGGRTLREVHEQLARLHVAPSVPGAPDPTDARGADVRDEFQSLNETFQRIAERWHVSPHDFVWRDYNAEQFTANDHGHAVAVLRRLADSTTELTATSQSVAAAIDWPQPKSLHDAEQLVSLGEHLLRAPVLEHRWLDVHPSDLAATADDAESSYGRLAHQQGQFEPEFPARKLDDFPADIALRVRAARDEVRRQAGWSAAWEDNLAALAAAMQALDDLPDLASTLRARAKAAAEITGQHATGLTEARITELADLAELAFSAQQRPQATWLVTAGLERAERVVEMHAETLRSYQSELAALLRHYTPEVLDLPAADIAARFTTQYTSVFSKLSGAYRQDAKAIKACRKSGKLPDDVVEELARVVSAQQLGERIDQAQQQLDQALGSYANGRDTDVEALQGALATGARILKLSAPDADLKQLAAMLAVDSPADAGAAQAADQLRGADRALRSRLPALSEFFGSVDAAGDVGDIVGSVENAAPSVRALAGHVADLDHGAGSHARGIVETLRRAELASELHAATTAVHEQERQWREVIGEQFAAADTSFDDVRRSAEWLKQLLVLSGGSIPLKVRGVLGDVKPTWPAFDELGVACASMRSHAEALTELFEADRARELDALLTWSAFGEAVTLCGQLNERVDELRDWTESRVWRGRASRQQWDTFIDALVDAGVGDDEVVAAFERAYWNRRLEALFREDPDLAEDLRGGAFQRWVDEFRELDQKLVRTGADRLITRRERIRTSHVSTPGSEVDLLRREARKKRRHLPVRVLLSRIPNLLSELKPCLMMSPLTVSHFLAAEHTFDVVVFDEASQVPPQDAINCIYRATQLIVAGDSKQLPPTPFFQIAELDELSPGEEEDSTQEDMESVLDACEALLPSHSLRWHYRSRAETLIAFSNRHIYDGALTTFPSAEEQSSAKGVGFVYVPDGVYDRGRTASNRREAQVVAQRVAHYLLDGSGRSVGVIAFNTAQANAITEELDLLKVQQPELEALFRGDRLDAVFVKHLEAVQGDERDVIVFSVGYGPDADGRFFTNFGPLNKEGGHRRLNVAITRAREKVELVSSVRSHDFHLSETASAGSRLLRDYVAYAEAEGRPGDETVVDAEDLFWPTALEEEIALAISELGYAAIPNVGFGSFRIDIGVRNPANSKQFLLGIECDGEAYAQTPTTRDRERLRHEVLDALGWGPIHRIWSLDWVRNRKAEIDRIHAALEAARLRQPPPGQQPADRVAAESPSDAEEPRERHERAVLELTSAAAASGLPWTRIYERVSLGHASSGYDFHETVNRKQQTDMLVELIAAEAPVSVDYAIRRVAEAWGLSRLGHRVVSAGRQAVGQAHRRGAVEIRGEFLWRPEQALTAVRIPDQADPRTRREIDEIAPEEIDLAIARLRESSAGVEDDQLISQVARVLGFDRAGGRIQAVLQARLAAIAADRRRAS